MEIDKEKVLIVHPKDKGEIIKIFDDEKQAVAFKEEAAKYGADLSIDPLEAFILQRSSDY